MNNPEPKLVESPLYYNGGVAKYIDGRFMVYQCNYCYFINHSRLIILQHQLECVYALRSQSDENLQESSPCEVVLVDKALPYGGKSVQNKTNKIKKTKKIEKAEKEKRVSNGSEEQNDKNDEQGTKKEEGPKKRESKRKSLQNKIEEKKSEEEAEMSMSLLAETEKNLRDNTWNVQVQTDPEEQAQWKQRCNLI